MGTLTVSGKAAAFESAFEAFNTLLGQNWAPVDAAVSAHLRTLRDTLATRTLTLGSESVSATRYAANYTVDGVANAISLVLTGSGVDQFFAAAPIGRATLTSLSWSYPGYAAGPISIAVSGAGVSYDFTANAVSGSFSALRVATPWVTLVANGMLNFADGNLDLPGGSVKGNVASLSLTYPSGHALIFKGSLDFKDELGAFANAGLVTEITLKTPEASATFKGSFNAIADPSGYSSLLGQITEASFAGGGLKLGYTGAVTLSSNSNGMRSLGGTINTISLQGEGFSLAGSGFYIDASVLFDADFTVKDHDRNGLKNANDLVALLEAHKNDGPGSGGTLLPPAVDFGTVQTLSSPTDPVGAVDTVAAPFDYTLPETVRNLILSANAALGIGNALGNAIQASKAGSLVRGLAGDDTLLGGAADDTLLGGADNDYLVGGEGGDRLEGGPGNDTLGGGSGDDTMIGGPGNDTYYVDSLADLVVENPGEGNADRLVTIFQMVDLALFPEIEWLTFGGDGVFRALGNKWNNRIVGGWSDDTLDGGLGADVLMGGAGNDTYVIDRAADPATGLPGDVVKGEAAAGVNAEDNDTILVKLATFALPAAWNVENLKRFDPTLTNAFTGTGNQLANLIEGGAGNDRLSGLAGNDTLIGLAGNDSLNGGDGNDTLNGGDGNDTLNGGLGDDLLIAGAGDDVFSGDGGNDTLDLTGLGLAFANKEKKVEGGFSLNKVDALTFTLTLGSQVLTIKGAWGATSGDRGIETFKFVDNPAVTLAQLLDGVMSYANDTYTDAVGIDDNKDGGLGNDTLDGAAGNDSLIGGGGADSLIGGLGDDTLVGGLGNDTLLGGAGTNRLEGGMGNDVYVIESATDTVVEGAEAGSGIDEVRTTLALYTLPDNVEKLAYIGSAAFAGTGNALANTITGGSGNDTLDGGGNDGKSDTLSGGAGDDTYFVYAGDVVRETTAAGTDAGGIDTVRTDLASYTLGAFLENLVYTGSSNFTGTGNALANTITGGSGSDRLFGGAGNDTLTGGAGNDSLYGGNGTGDVACFAGSIDQYVVSRSKLGYVVTGADGSDYLEGIEFLQFGNGAAQPLTAFFQTSLPQLQALPGHVLPAMTYAASDGARWNAGSPPGTPVTLTYSFMQAIPSYSFAGEHPGFAPMNETQKAAVRLVLEHYSRIANLTFIEVADGGGGGQLRFGTDRQVGSAGYAYVPTLSDPVGGDVWLANDQSSNASFAPGGYGLATLIHEVGHALGLKHPGGYTAGDAPPYLPMTENTTRYTVMSYHDRADGKVVEVSGTPTSYTYSIRDWAPETAMLYDVAAIQSLYGANTTAAAHAGNNRYVYPSDRPFFATLWDGGGIDVIDCSAFDRRCEIRLQDGAYSSLGLYDTPRDALPSWYAGDFQPTYAGQFNLAIAYGALIENAIGGSGNDILSGNGAANELSGGPGSDTLTGGDGGDVFIFDVAPSSTNGVDLITDFVAGTDRILLDTNVFALSGPALGGAFHAGANVLAATEPDDRILYDTVTGYLYYDSDGTGGAAAVRFAQLGSSAHPAITSADFMLA